MKLGESDGPRKTRAKLRRREEMAAQAKARAGSETGGLSRK